MSRRRAQTHGYTELLHRHLKKRTNEIGTCASCCWVVFTLIFVRKFTDWHWSKHGRALSLSCRHSREQCGWTIVWYTESKEETLSIAGSIFRCQLFIKWLWSSYLGFIFTSLTNDFEYRHSVTTEMLESEFWNKQVRALSFLSFVYYGSQHPRDTERCWCRAMPDW